MKKWLIHEVRLPVGTPETTLPRAAARKLGIAPEEVQDWGIVRKSLDARKKDSLAYKYSLWVQADAAAHWMQKRGAAPYEAPVIPEPNEGEKPLDGRILVVGAGPCGLFAAYRLAKRGYRPLLLERGKPIEARAADFARLQAEGVLDPESNACFGEGGAGAFSDGKLTARNKDPFAAKVMEIFIHHGAPREIAYLAKPHLGTDGIRRIIASMREEIRKSGGEILFEARLEKLLHRDGQLVAAEYVRQGQQHRIDCGACILAIGHSARDTFSALAEAGVYMQPKPFAMGVRVEHPREMIDNWQYGALADELGAAEYTLKTQVAGKGVYSFCMCPGGEVICSATEEGRTAVNGMSWHDRAQPFSNSAIVVSVAPEDMPAGVFGGIALQRQLEGAAYRAAGGYGAPAQTYVDFLAGRVSARLPENSYRPYAAAADLAACLPDFIRTRLAGAATAFEHAIPGFVSRGLLLGVETRTSSPVRIVRDASYRANILGIYPGGEGAGYAGGIMSAAIDGLRIAGQLISEYRRP